MDGFNPYTMMSPLAGMMGSGQNQHGGMRTLGDFMQFGMSPMGYMLTQHPNVGVAMLSPFAFGLSRLFR